MSHNIEIERMAYGADAIGHLPEILDGDAPHEQRGCDAQAWGVSEFVRVFRLLDDVAPKVP